MIACFQKSVFTCITLGRPLQHRQVSCIPIAKWKQLLNSNLLWKTKQPALNLPMTEQQASME